MDGDDATALLDRAEENTREMQAMKSKLEQKKGIIGTDGDTTQFRKGLEGELKEADALMKFTDELKKPSVRDKLKQASPQRHREVKSQSQETRFALQKVVKEIKSETSKKATAGSGVVADADLSREEQLQVQDVARNMRALNTESLEIEERIQREKAQGILRIEADMEEVHGMYHDLDRMVKDQQGGIDTAQEKVTKTRENVQDGTKDLQQASKYQKSSRKKMICVCILLIVIIGILVVVITVAS